MSEPGQNRKSSMRAYVFRCSSNNGHHKDRAPCPKGAMNGLMHRSKTASLFDHLVGAGE